MKAKEIFIVTHEEYADFAILATLKARKAFSWDEEATKYAAAHAAQREDCHKFVAHLVALKLVEEVNLRAVHAGQNGKLSRDGANDLEDRAEPGPAP